MVWAEKASDLVVKGFEEMTIFFQKALVDVKHFFTYGVLAEIVGKWYSKKPVADNDGIVPLPDTESSEASRNEQSEDDAKKLWCYCSQPSFGNMLCCDNKSWMVPFRLPTDKVSTKGQMVLPVMPQISNI